MFYLAAFGTCFVTIPGFHGIQQKQRGWFYFLSRMALKKGAKKGRVGAKSSSKSSPSAVSKVKGLKLEPSKQSTSSSAAVSRFASRVTAGQISPMSQSKIRAQLRRAKEQTKSDFEKIVTEINDAEEAAATHSQTEFIKKTLTTLDTAQKQLHELEKSGEKLHEGLHQHARELKSKLTKMGGELETDAGPSEACEKYARGYEDRLRDLIAAGSRG